MKAATTKRRGGNESAVTRVRDAMVARVRGDHSESGVALLSAILFMVIMAGISVVLLSTVLGQIVPSNLAQRNTKTVYAAQAGMQASLAMLRSASLPPDSDGKVYGDMKKLSCAVSGRVDAQNNGLSYTAAISYYLVDPTKTVGAATLGCGAAITQQPKYAKITSTGSAVPVSGVSSTPSGSRTLSAIYTFKVTNVNIPGGRIFDRNNNYCLEATGTTAGSNVKFTAKSNCTQAKDNLQLWVYDTDYELKLASTTVAGATQMCITGPAKKNDSGTQNATLQTCAVQQWNQLWSWSGSYTWQGQQYDITKGYSSYYLAGSFAEGNYLQVTTSVSGTFNPSSAVGPGAASFATLQIVNYQEFGRCLDVTDENIGRTFMISYPCKQDPSGLGSPSGTKYLNWNHKWTYLEPNAPASNPTVPSSVQTTISVLYNNDASQKYCLQIPDPTLDPTNFNPRLQPCVAGATLQKWTRVKNTGTYATSYLFVDSLGRCLAVNPGDLYNGWSKIIVATCDNSLAQKWNSPAGTEGGTLGSYQEGATP